MKAVGFRPSEGRDGPLREGFGSRVLGVYDGQAERANNIVQLNTRGFDARPGGISMRACLVEQEDLFREIDS